MPKLLDTLLNALALLFIAFTVLFLTANPSHALSGSPAAENVGMYNQVAFGASTVNTLAAAANVARNYLILQNQSAASTITVSLGNSTVGISLTAGTILQLNPAFTDAIWAKGPAGISTLLIIEGTK